VEDEKFVIIERARIFIDWHLILSKLLHSYDTCKIFPVLDKEFMRNFEDAFKGDANEVIRIINHVSNK